MSYARVLLLSAMLMPSVLFGQVPAGTPADTSFYAVSYVETRPDAVKAARAALAQYRAASRKQDGFVRVEFFEQVGRPGHFAVLDTWRDQQGFDARDVAAQKQLQAALQPIRVSDYDQRPYKPLTTAPGSASPGPQAVYVIAHVDVSQNSEAPLLLRRLAEASRQEGGSFRFDVLQHTTRANHFTVVEGWRSQQALDAHVAAEHTRVYRDRVQPLTGSPLDERLYSSVE